MALTTSMPLHTTDIQDVDRFETAIILAALRLLQAAPALPSEIVEIATDYGAFEQLEGAAIDDLCERINAASEYPFRDVSEESAQ
ncbi:MAG: hypothetical protein Q4P24_11775 [Rhodobacterales bacterium]|nr:hypothetical protein [Rhodobacterales bacterium]